MELHPLPADEAAVRRYVRELWIPYNRDLEATVEAFALDDEVDLVPAETEFRLGQLAEESHRAWIAVDGTTDETADTPDIADLDGDFAGFVVTAVDEAPTVFDRPDRLLVCDVFVQEGYRGSGLAEDLMERAVERAREAGCGEVVLDVDVDNERALAFYDKLDFEPRRYRMRVDVDELSGRVE